MRLKGLKSTTTTTMTFGEDVWSRISKDKIYGRLLAATKLSHLHGECQSLAHQSRKFYLWDRDDGSKEDVAAHSGGRHSKNNIAERERVWVRLSCLSMEIRLHAFSSKVVVVVVELFKPAGHICEFCHRD